MVDCAIRPLRALPWISSMPNALFLIPTALAILAGTLAMPACASPIGVPAIPQAATRSPLQVKIAAGDAAIGRNDLAAAETAFSDALKLDATSPQALLGLADVARLRGNSADIEKWLNRALEVAPQVADVQRAWGRRQFALQNFQAAEAALKKAARLDPASLATQLDLGDLYTNWLPNPVEAAAAYRQALRLQPNHAGAHFGLGLALASQKKVADALSEFEQAAKLAPENPLPMTAAGRLHASTGNPEKALAAFGRALAVKPDYVPALLARGDIYILRNDLPRAVADFEAAAKAAPKNAEAQFRLGAAFAMLHRYDDAERQYRAAVAADPDFAVAYNNLAANAAEHGRNLDTALDWAKRATALKPDNAEFQDTLGNVYLARGDVESAIDAFRKASASRPANASFYYNLGRALARKGNNPEAIEAFKQTLSANPKFAHAADARKRIAELGGK